LGSFYLRQGIRTGLPVANPGPVAKKLLAAGFLVE